MKYLMPGRAAGAAVVAMAAAVAAQTVSPPVQDTAPLPPEDRSSPGALVIEKPGLATPPTRSMGAAPVPAPAQVGRDTDRMLKRDRAREEAKAARKARAERLRGGGAGSQTVD